MDFNSLDWRDTALVIALAFAAGLTLLKLILGRLGNQSTPAVSNSDAAPRHELRHSAIEAELRELRAELAALRTDLAALRTDLDQLKAARRAAPQYEEALALAGRGADPHSIAQHCGISVAEAELLQALSRRPQE